jgi:peroxiredoxin
LELDALNENVDAISTLGARLVLVSPNTIAHNQTVAEQKKLACELFSDPGNTVAARYGLKYTMAADLKALYQQFGVDLEDYNGDASWTLPLPARMIIDTDGIVRYAAINADYTVRPDPAETIAALKTII